MNKENKVDKICINKLIDRKKEIIMVEGDMIVPDAKPDILNIINTSGCVSINKKEMTKGKIKISGNISAYIMYLSENEKVRGINNNIDFMENININKCNENTTDISNIVIKNIETQLINGRKINTKVILEVEIEIHEKEETELYKNEMDESFKIKQKKKKVNLFLGNGNVTTTAKETIFINKEDELVEILKVNIDVLNQDIKLSYNKILVKSELNIKIIYLTQDNKIGKAEKNIPIVGFIEIKNIQEESKYNINLEARNIVIKPNQIEEHSIYVEAEFFISAEVYKEEEIEVIEDIYNTKNIITLNRRNIEFIKCENQNKYEKEISEKIELNEISREKIIDIDINFDGTKKGEIESKLLGEMEIKILYLTNSNEADIKIIKVPIEIEEDSDYNYKNKKLKASMKDKKYILEGEQKLKIEATLELETEENQTDILELIENIQIEKEREKEDYSILMYIAKEGDSLWKIAKKFGSTVEDIVKLNKIEDENNINIGQKIFIPSYREKNKLEYA